MLKPARDNRAIACIKGGTVCTLLCSLLILKSSLLYGETVLGPEYEVKLGFIYNFINFVTWPPQAFENSSQELTLCFAAKDSSSDALYRLDGKTVKGRKIKVIPYQEGACVQKSHVLFFATQDTQIIQEALELTEGQNILTIGEVKGFTKMGGVINFFEERNRLRFKINTSAAKRSALKMSSQLLGSAQIVEEAPE